MPRDYFSFETIRDHERNVICYFITAIGTIEKDGVPHLKTDLGEDGNQKMAFGKVTLHNLDRTISHLLADTSCRIFSHDTDIKGESVDVISFSAREWRAEEACTLEEGDRVLVEGRGYIRKPDAMHEGSRSEMRITATGIFRLGRAGMGKKHVSFNNGMLPQNGIK
ncbi:MAG: hypothetical protein LKF53_07010 [Solobacterium sp.]|jgi:hypothetical protein|nr:hypothetical protein [Solobacterium sp.]MCH4206124.1 hypothetical protein [Solobacterium sp.]MCH4227590.1 hypothetical protein [Solobacterium sp.]MCH4282610.1 hypothetical protein [Solobacterium sp.]NLH62574.1 hypothetical protein [Erysipelotrichaceae bacterium]